MSNRVVVLIVSISAVIVIGGIGTAIYLSRGFISDAVHVFEEGSAFGRGKEAPACVDEAVRRYDPKRDIMKQALDSAFVLACLPSAKVSDEFCASVPAMDARDQTAAKAWADESCRERDRDGPGCALIFIQVANYCHSKR